MSLETAPSKVTSRWMFSPSLDPTSMATTFHLEVARGPFLHSPAFAKLSGIIPNSFNWIISIVIQQAGSFKTHDWDAINYARFELFFSVSGTFFLCFQLSNNTQGLCKFSKSTAIHWLYNSIIQIKRSSLNIFQ